MNIRELVCDGILFFDGAMGTMLQQRGLEPGGLPELLNLSNPGMITEIHREYVRAGADVITANTFQAHAFKLGSEHAARDVIRAGVRCAKEAGARFVALDIGPLGQLLEPMGTVSFEQAYEMFRIQVSTGAQAGADLILIETMSDPYEAKAAILAAKENADLPVICSMTFQEGGRTFTGCDALTATMLLQGLGVDALGVNCSLGPASLGTIAETMLEHSRLPVIVQANAGLPSVLEGRTFYEFDPERYAAHVAGLARLGVRIIGGCCGTTPEHTRLLRERLGGVRPVETDPLRVHACTSGTRTVLLGDAPVAVGTCLGLDKKEAARRAAPDGGMDELVDEALDQAQSGVQLLHIDAARAGVDTPEKLALAVREIQSVTGVPLRISGAGPAALAAALRVYNGKPCLCLERETDDEIAQIALSAQKYGALIETADAAAPERRARIRDTAAALGIPAEDLRVN